MSHKLRHVVRWACLVSAIGATGVAVLSGCSDDDDAGGGGTADAGNDARSDAGTQPGTDSGNPGTDSGQQQTDGGNDSGNEPTVTVTVGPTGLIAVTEGLAFAEFHEDDTIVHVSNAPECVAYVRSATKPYSVAGEITVGGQLVGQPGGPAAPLTFNADPAADNTYAGFFENGEVFYPNPGSGETVEVQLAGTNTMPAMPVTTLRAPVLDTLPMLEPTVPDSGVIAHDSKKPLVLKWQVPDAGPAAGQRALFHSVNISTLKYAVTIDCSWPLSAGTGTVPAALLSYLRQRVGAGELSGTVQLDTGDAKEVTAGGASYTVLVSRFLTLPTPALKID